MPVNEDGMPLLVELAPLVGKVGLFSLAKLILAICLDYLECLFSFSLARMGYLH